MMTKLRKGLSEKFEVQGKEKYMWPRIFIEALCIYELKINVDLI